MTVVDKIIALAKEIEASNTTKEEYAAAGVLYTLAAALLDRPGEFTKLMGVVAEYSRNRIRQFKAGQN